MIGAILAATFLGCGGIAPAARVVIALILKLPWDRIVQVALNSLEAVVIVKGLLNGRDVEERRALTSEEFKQLKRGASVRIEYKDGSAIVAPSRAISEDENANPGRP
jgi:hypothetical protein